MNDFQDPHACGEIILGSFNDGYFVDEEVPVKLSDRMNIFMLHVPHRAGGGFPLVANSEDSKKRWIEALNSVIAETTGSPDQSVAPVTYEDDDEIYATIK